MEKRTKTTKEKASHHSPEGIQCDRIDLGGGRQDSQPKPGCHPNGNASLGHDLSTPININNHISAVIPVLEIVDMLPFFKLPIYPHKSPVDFMRYIYDLIRSLPQYRMNPDYTDRKIKELIGSQTNVRNSLFVLLDYFDEMFSQAGGNAQDNDSLLIGQWGDRLYSSEELGTKSQPMLFRTMLADIRTAKNTAYWIELSFLPALEKKDKKLHDILVRLFAFLNTNIGVMSFPHYADYSLESLKDMADEISSYNARVDIEDSVEQTVMDDNDPGFNEIMDAVAYWESGDEIAKYSRLIDNQKMRYSLKGTKQMIRNYPWKRKDKMHVRAWVDKLIPFIEKKFKIRDYCFHGPFSDDEAILPNEYICLRWGIDDQVEHFFDEDIENRWGNGGFAPIRMEFDMVKNPLDFVRQQFRNWRGEHQDITVPKWNQSDDAYNFMLMIEDACSLFTRLSATNNFHKKDLK